MHNSSSGPRKMRLDTLHICRTMHRNTAFAYHMLHYWCVTRCTYAQVNIHSTATLKYRPKQQAPGSCRGAVALDATMMRTRPSLGRHLLQPRAVKMVRAWTPIAANDFTAIHTALTEILEMRNNRLRNCERTNTKYALACGYLRVHRC